MTRSLHAHICTWRPSDGGERRLKIVSDNTYIEQNGGFDTRCWDQCDSQQSRPNIRIRSKQDEKINWIRGDTTDAGCGD